MTARRTFSCESYTFLYALYRTIDAAFDAAVQVDALVQYNAYKKVYDSQDNVRRTVINALNVAVPQAYRQVTGGGVGVRNYRPTDSPMAILASLRRLYGRLTPHGENGHGSSMDHPVEYLVSDRDVLRSPRGLFRHGDEQPPPPTRLTR